MTYEEYKAMKIKETLDYHGITRWHELGFKGKGINFLELEDSSHGESVVEVFSYVAPEAKTFLHGYRTRCTGDELIYFDVDINGEYIDLKKFVTDNNIHIIGLSTSGGMAKPAEEYIKSLGVILVASAGNEGSEGVTATLENVAINTGSAKILSTGKIILEQYSGRGEDTISFATLHMHLSGTSFSQPTLSGMIALIMSRYGIMTQDKIIEVLKLISIDAGEYGYDTSFGWGVPILPEEIEMLETEEETMNGQHTVLYSHLDRIIAIEGETVNAELPWRKASNIGIMGNTGSASKGAHVHICVIEGIKRSLWHLADMVNALVPSKQQLDYFVDETLFDYPVVITNGWLGYTNHYAYDAVPEDRHSTNEHYEIKWNRRFAGRVLKTGYDSVYGNYVLIGYDTLQY